MLCNEVIGQLKNADIINDNRLANILAQRYLCKGNRFIKETLEERCIQEPIISATIASLEPEVERAMKEVEND
jgi:SOS response regulatory protein OraA/RecX